MKTKRKHIAKGIVSYIRYSIKCYKSYGCYFTYHCNLKGKNHSEVRKVPEYGCGVRKEDGSCVGVSMGVVQVGNMFLAQGGNMVLAQGGYMVVMQVN